MLAFMGIGAQKAGTSWLASHLSKHPKVNIPLKKEHHYWNKGYLHEGRAVYLKRFSQPDLIEGEITPAYAFLPISQIKTIHEVQPALKLIYIIRNPIERAWSSAKMACGRAEMTLDEASDQWFIDHFNSRGSLLRGDYQMAIEHWLSVFSKEQLLVLNFSDIRNHPKQLLNRCFQHLDVETLSSDVLNTFNLSQRVFSGHSAPLRESLKKPLQAIYASKISALEHYLSWDLSEWKQE